MTFIPDLSPCWYLDRHGSSPGLVAIGWLAGGRPFSEGDVEPTVRRRLAALLRHPYCLFAFMGYHACDLCTGSAHDDDPESGRGLWNLIVPGRDCLFACPEMIAHYIDAHRYRPPDVFLDAVSRCPEVGTEEYFLAILRIGGSAWADVLESHGTGMLELEDKKAFGDAPYRAWLWTEQIRARNGLRAVASWRASHRNTQDWRARVSGLLRGRR